MSTYKTVQKDGITTIEVGDLDAEMLVSAYVPDFQELGLTFAEAYDLACERDNAAAAQLEMDASNAEDYEVVDLAYVAMVNAALARAEEENAAQAEQEYHFIVGTLLDMPVTAIPMSEMMAA